MVERNWLQHSSLYVEQYTNFLSSFQGEEITQVVWTGEGLAVQKAVNCADIMKKRNKVSKQRNKFSAIVIRL